MLSLCVSRMSSDVGKVECVTVEDILGAYVVVAWFVARFIEVFVTVLDVFV